MPALEVEISNDQSTPMNALKQGSHERESAVITIHSDANTAPHQ
uniref:Matrin-type domain-containing protein n=1 Tax=Parascaris univalens TaxID=6257 RepID=A0A915C8M5_PARUN